MFKFKASLCQLLLITESRYFVKNFKIYFRFKFKASLGLNMPSRLGYCPQRPESTLFSNFYPQNQLESKIDKNYKNSHYFQEFVASAVLKKNKRGLSSPMQFHLEI